MPGDTATYKRHHSHPCIYKRGKRQLSHPPRRGMHDSRRLQSPTGRCSPQALPLDPRQGLAPVRASNQVWCPRAPPTAERAQHATQDIGPQPRRGRCSAEHFPSGVHRTPCALVPSHPAPPLRRRITAPSRRVRILIAGRGACDLTRSQRSTLAGCRAFRPS